MAAQWPGYFISFEGLDGAGKSTQVASLGGALRSDGRDFISLRPSDTELGEMAQSFLLTHQADMPLDPWAEAMLFIASRVQLFRETILPALEAGRVVVVDRWADSTLAYQGGGRGIDLDELRTLHRHAVDDVWPDATIFLDLPLHVAMGRQRAAQLPLDRIEQAPEDFHSAVEGTFRALVAAEPERFIAVDAGQPATVVARNIWERLRPRLGSAGTPLARDAAPVTSGA